MSAKTFVYSDTHINHANIIRYCSRPFTDVEAMNSEIIRRWNDVVSDGDTVFFLGDFAFSKHPQDWLMKLNGNINMIKGNHDFYLKAPCAMVINHHGEKLLLTHKPCDDLSFWKGWTIAGHHHNNDLIAHPLINNFTKVFNVSCELNNYYPIELNLLLSMRN